MSILARLSDNCKKIASTCNKYGIPIPTARDPLTGLGSVSFSLVAISTALLAAGIIGKWSKFLGNVNMQEAKEFFMYSLALYFSRRYSSKDQKKEDNKNTDV